MMRKVLLTPILLVGLAGVAPAQDASLYLSAGVGLPADPPEFRDFWDAGAGLGVGVGLRLSRDWEIVGRFRLHRFPADGPAQARDLLLAGFGITSGVETLEGRDATATSLLAETRIHLGGGESRWDPFLAFGWGYFELRTSDAIVIPERPELAPVTIVGENDAAFAVLAGLGVDVRLSRRVRILLEADNSVGFTEPVSTQYLALRAGLGIGL